MNYSVELQKIIRQYNEGKLPTWSSIKSLTDPDERTIAANLRTKLNSELKELKSKQLNEQRNDILNQLDKIINKDGGA
tara:strand:- start:239 stop:472 length:234 start_codon:yes stop_codon:yes gene_type:complete